MRLSVYKSFEPAVLQRVLGAWNAHLALFTSIAVRGPSQLAWGAQAPLDEGELRVFIIEAPALDALLAGGAPALQSGATGPVPLLVLCPADGDDAWEATHQATALRAGALGLRADLLDGLATARAAGLADADIFDRESRALAQVPYSDGYYLNLAGALMRRAWARLRPAAKVLAVDCDDTLWRGLCAEAGAAGVEVGPEERALHALLLEQKRAGRLLVLVSKNVPADVDAVFERRKDLGLTAADFAARRIGWDPKPQALRELARELRLGLDSFIFLDDSPAECAAVRAALPEVAVVHRPSTGLLRLLGAVWPLDLGQRESGGLGEARTRLYLEEVLRREAQRAAPSFAGHVASLQIKCGVRAATGADEARLFELAQRTNQFNTRPGRPPLEDVRTAIGAGRALAVEVADRFGDYGLCGAVFLGEPAAPEGEVLAVERLLLSCRVLGRGVEEELFERLLARARSAGCRALEVRLEPTDRNQPVVRFFERLAGLRPDGCAQGPGLRFDAAMGPVPRDYSEAVPAEGPSTRPASAAAPDWMEVARLTLDPQALAPGLGLTSDPTLRPVPRAHGPGAADEAAVLAVLSEVLGREVGRSDNLYALGADSLRLVRVLARLKSVLGLELPTAEVFHRADVADLLALASRAPGAGFSPEAAEDPDYLGQIQSLYDDAEGGAESAKDDAP